MKKRIMLLLSLAVILVGITIAPLASASTCYVYTSNGKGLNFRSDYTMDANNIMGSIPYGAKVEVLDFLESDYWAQVSYNGRTGYVMTRYLVPNPPPAKKPSNNSGGGSSSNKSTAGLDFSSFVDAQYNATIRPSAPGGFVNLRWAPSKSMTIRERMYDGQTLEVLAQDKTWAQVRLPDTGRVGFVMRSFLNEAAGASPPGGDS